MCIKTIEELEKIDNDNILTLVKSNSIIEKKRFIIKIINECVFNKNIKVGVINSKVNIATITKVLVHRHISINKRNGLTKEDINQYFKKIKNLGNSNLYISYTTQMNTNELLEKIKLIKKEKDVKLIIIDNICTLVDYEEQKDYVFEEIENLCNQLKISIIIIGEERG